MTSLVFAIGACAFMGAVLSTLPIGPVNLLSLYFTLNGKSRLWRHFIVGILIADTVVCVFATQVLAFHSENLLGDFKRYVPYLSVLLALLLLLLGLRLLFSGRPDSDSKYSDLKEDCLRHRLTVIAGGFVATAMSPGLFIFWFAWWLKWFVDFSHFDRLESSLAVTVGLCLGDILVFGIYRKLALRFGPNLIDRSSLKRINQGIGGIMIALAIFVGFSF
ncbi:MAG: hypothetical protein H7318_11800 [Oligoflexus sp.]|nr:hypothetical protein [Oligoflexus sp.]